MFNRPMSGKSLRKQHIEICLIPFLHLDLIPIVIAYQDCIQGTFERSISKIVDGKQVVYPEFQPFQMHAKGYELFVSTGIFYIDVFSFTEGKFFEDMTVDSR